MELVEINNEPYCKHCKQLIEFIQEEISQKGGELGQVYPITINGKKGCFTKEMLAEKLNFTGNILVLDDKNLLKACAFLTVKSKKEGEDLIQNFVNDQVITEIEWFETSHLGFGHQD